MKKENNEPDFINPLKKARKTAIWVGGLAFAASYGATINHADNPNYRLLIQVAVTSAFTVIAFILSWANNSLKKRKYDRKQ